jgi:hypothetical protein
MHSWKWVSLAVRRPLSLLALTQRESYHAANGG